MNFFPKIYKNPRARAALALRAISLFVKSTVVGISICARDRTTGNGPT
jgi:hypothetical protein